MFLRPICRESRWTAQLATTVLPTSCSAQTAGVLSLCFAFQRGCGNRRPRTRADAMRVARDTGAIGRSAARLTAVASVALAVSELAVRRAVSSRSSIQSGLPDKLLIGGICAAMLSCRRAPPPG